MGYGSNAVVVAPRVEGLTPIDVVDVAAGIHRDSQRIEGHCGRCPRADVDVNNVINIVGRHAVDPVRATAEYMNKLSQRGMVVTPVCDGDSRPNAKQASNDNTARRQKSRNKAVTSRQELHRLSERLKVERLNEEERNHLLDQRKKLEKALRTAENASINIVPGHLPDLLEECLCKMHAHDVNASGGCVASVITAKFQADALMGGRFRAGKSDLIVSNDADMRGFYGGDDCVCLTGMTGREHTISSSSKKTLEKAISYLCPESQRKVKLVCGNKKQVYHPIFEGWNSLKLRALIGVIIGCDVCPKGIRDCGPSKVGAKLMELAASTHDEDEIYNQLMDYAVEMSRAKPPIYERDVLQTFVDGLVYEPTNEAAPEGTSSTAQHTYLGDAPSTLPSYLTEFGLPTTKIEQGPHMLECKGAKSDGSASHAFLAAVPHYQCSTCSQTVCRLCEANIGKEHYCCGCNLIETLLPGLEAEDVMPIADMREELKNKYNFDGVDALGVEEVEEVWESHAIHRAVMELAEGVEFPVLPTSALASGEHWEELAEIDFRFGGAFLLKSSIDEKYIPDILELFAAFVYFAAEKKKYTKWQNDGSVFAAVPEMFIAFADKCRAVGIGYRLLKRCLRHAFDCRTESLDNKTAKLILYRNQLGIHLSCPIPASMKKDVYDGDTVLTKDLLLCCECACKSGSKGTDKVGCVHTLARAMMLSILIAEDLAEHMLRELASVVTSAYIEEDTWSEEQIGSMKRSILTLAKASGNNALADEMTESSTLYQMLQKYRTGTQQRNEWKRAHKPPREDEIGPITEVVFDSPEQKAKVLFKQTKPKARPSDAPVIVQFDPDYVRTGLLMNAAGIDPSEFGFVGFRIHEHRRKRQEDAQPLDSNQKSHALLAAQKEWKELLEEAEQRSTRRSPKQLANLETRQRRHVVTPPSPTATGSTSTSSPKRKPRHTTSNICAKCGNNSDMKGLRFHRIPPYPADLKPNATLKRKVTHRGKLWLRQEVMDRAGYPREDRTEGLRVCSDHVVELKRETLDITHRDKRFHQTYEFTLISGAGAKSSLCPSKDTKGVARDRFAQRQLTLINSKRKRATSPDEPPSDETALQREKRLRIEAESDAASWRMTSQQLLECLPLETQQSICPSTSKAAGFVTEKKARPSHPNDKKLFKFAAIGGPKPSQNGSDNTATKAPPKPRNSTLPPAVLPCDTNTGRCMTDDEVKWRTGFTSLKHLLAYIIVISNGDVDRIRKRSSSLTWFEERVLYFEWKHHQTCRRQDDFKHRWGLYADQVNSVKDCMAELELAALRSWPTFASYAEDTDLRDREKWSRYDGQRPIMWDMTNVSAMKFEDASLQRSTYNEYYSENCFKGGVSSQLCGWSVLWALWTGAVTDTVYNEKAGYLQEQKRYQETDLINGEIVKFLNVLDRGYRAKFAAWQCGGQMAIQPPSAKSDRRFQGRETVYAGCIAHDRSGNERSVNVGKRSGLFKRGFKPGMSAQRFNNAWMSWGFQANFMYKPVL